MRARGGRGGRRERFSDPVVAILLVSVRKGDGVGVSGGGILWRGKCEENVILQEISGKFKL